MRMGLVRASAISISNYNIESIMHANAKNIKRFWRFFGIKLIETKKGKDGGDGMFCPFIPHLPLFLFWQRHRRAWLAGSF